MRRSARLSAERIVRSVSLSGERCTYIYSVSSLGYFVSFHAASTSGRVDRGCSAEIVVADLFRANRGRGRRRRRSRRLASAARTFSVNRTTRSASLSGERDLICLPERNQDRLLGKRTP